MAEEGASVQTEHFVNEVLMRRLREIDADRGWTVKVGVFGPKGDAPEKPRKRADGSDAPAKETMSVLQVACIQEFGTEDIPARPFIRVPDHHFKEAVKEEQREILEKFLDGKVTLHQGLSILGQSIVNKIKRRVKDHISPENAPSTIARKGSSTPLVDTGQLINSITFEVEKR